jgi:DNA uptake protein ComE-like DNA-binding protein
MYGTLFSQLRAHVVSINPRHVDQLTIAVAAIIGLGILTLVHLGSQRTIADVRQPPTFVIDPNAASKAELLLLPRVGPSLAGAILKEREILAFESAEDISRTRGIGDKTLLKLLPHLRVTEEPSR